MLKRLSYLSSIWLKWVLRCLLPFAISVSVKGLSVELSSALIFFVEKPSMNNSFCFTNFWLKIYLVLFCFSMASVDATEKLGLSDIVKLSNESYTRVEISLPKAVDIRVVDMIQEYGYFFIDIYSTVANFPDKSIHYGDGNLKGLQVLKYADRQIVRLIFHPQNKTVFRVADSSSGFVFESTDAFAKSLPQNKRHKVKRLVVDTVRYKHYPLPPLDTVRQKLRVRGSSSGQRTKKLVVIDAGHGGDDGGAQSLKKIHGKKLQEKDIVLDVARELQRLLNKSPNVQAVMTRNKDVKMGLRERVDFTEGLEADLFISIHANAARYHRGNSSPRGIEFYFLRGASHANTRALERAENEDEDGELDGEADAQWNLIRKNLIRDILDMQRGLGAQASDYLYQSFMKDPYFKRFNRGVKQAAFRVLMNRVTPSVLIEIGFIDHPREVVSLSNRDFRKRISKRIANGVMEYLAQVDSEVDYYQYNID